MIPRILVPVDARPPAQNGVEPTTRRRPTSLDERTLVPAMLPIVVLDGRSTIPANGGAFFEKHHPPARAGLAHALARD